MLLMTSASIPFLLRRKKKKKKQKTKKHDQSTLQKEEFTWACGFRKSPAWLQSPGTEARVGSKEIISQLWASSRVQGSQNLLQRHPSCSKALPLELPQTAQPRINGPNAWANGTCSSPKPSQPWTSYPPTLPPGAVNIHLGHHTLFYIVLEPRISCRLGKHSTNWGTSYGGLKEYGLQKRVLLLGGMALLE